MAWLAPTHAPIGGGIAESDHDNYTVILDAVHCSTGKASTATLLGLAIDQRAQEKQRV